MTGSANENSFGGSNNDRQVKPIDNPAGSGLVPKQGGTKPVNGGAMSSPNPSGDRSSPNNGVPTGNPGAVNGTSTNESKTSNNPNTGSAGNSRLQCIKNCQIAKLQDLQDSDGGKDRLRIRVTIDANGMVTAAEIAKSSGNPHIDKTVLEGIEHMQFQPSGKPIKGIIRANIFL
jgi:TonB family protein